MKIAIFAYWFTRKQRPQHLAETLVRAGHQVEVFSTCSLARMAIPGREMTRQTEARIGLRIRGVFPSPRFDGLALARSFNLRQRKRMLTDFVAYPADIHIYGAPPMDPPPRKPACLVYDCMDDWSDYPGLPPSLRQAEKRICEMADRVWVVSKPLFEKFKSSCSGKLDYVANGVEYDHFAGIPARARVGVSPELGYVGAVYEWLDVDLVVRVARLLPDWRITLVGPVSLDAELQKKLKAEPNIRLLGGHPYEALPGIMATFSVTMIPFVLNDLILGTSPIKLYEYLAAGLPVVATAMPEVLALEEPGAVACARNAGEFAAAVKAMAASNSPERVARRQTIARSYTWTARFIEALRRVPHAGGRGA